jgi:DNA-binding CsgD family transcriptional regulator
MFASRLVDVVESAYLLDGDDHAWLTGLANAARPALDRGLGVVAYLGEARTLKTVAFATSGVSEGVCALLQAVSDSTPRNVQESFLGQPMRFVSVSETFFADSVLRGHWEAAGRAFGLVDGVGVYAHAASRRSIHLFAPSASIEHPQARERRAWLRIASHLAAAHRVRTLLGKPPSDAQCDAILDPRGRVHDARNSATSSDACEALREAVQAMERARGPMRRHDGERALELWRGLAAGRWSLVDRWDSDGKRFIAAIENSPDNLDPRALRAREGAAARLAADGAAPKDIAYALGVSPSNARALLASALAKLGLTSRAELFRWNPSHAHIHVVSSNPALEAMVIPEQKAEPRSIAFAALTNAEAAVASLAAEGMSNLDIARARGTSVRTIANQMATILRKLGVSSRDDILRRAVPEARASA